MMAGSAFVEKDVTADASKVCLEGFNTEVYISQQSSTYIGKAEMVWECAWALKLCSDGNMLLVDKTGINPIEGEFYRITVNGIGDCGGAVTSIQEISCDPYYY